MKKLFLIPMLGLLLAGCAEQDVVADADQYGSESSPSSFLSVSIVSGNSTGTRANGDYTEDGGIYRDGTEEESYVKNVLFLFYDAEGNPAEAIKKGDRYYTYSLWENVNDSTTSDSLHSETVEHILKNTIRITVPRKDNKPVLPAQLVAIINPPMDDDETIPTDLKLAKLTTSKLAELTNIVADFETGYLARKDGKFVMTNSVYVDKDNNIVKTKLLDEGDFHDDVNEAVDNPVVVYVERVLARIDLGIDIEQRDEETTSTYKKIIPATGDPYYIYFTGVSTSTAEEDRDVYVRFLGWNVYHTPDKSYLIKEIDKEWIDRDEDIFGKLESGITEPWNAWPYHRSFWAINPAKDRFDYKHGSFKKPGNAEFYDEWTANQYKIAAPGEYTTAYFQENAAPDEDPFLGPTKPSSIIIAAQLVNADGTSRELVKWGGQYYTWDDLLAQFCSTMNYWYRTSEPDANGNTIYTYTHITPADLTWQEVANSNNVDIALTDAAMKKEWYELDENVDKDEATTDDFGKVEASAINTFITDTYGSGNVKYWREGYTCFTAPIRHLGLVDTSPGYYGVVRNHIYEARITSVTGLGTPVVNPEKDIVIYPEDEEEKNLSAKVRILSWRVVSQSYDLTW